MTMKIEFKTDDKAFDGDAADEASRVIRNVAELVALGKKSGNIVDINDNRIGHYAFKR